LGYVYLFLAVLGFELKASCFLGAFPIESHPNPIFLFYFLWCWESNLKALDMLEKHCTTELQFQPPALCFCCCF
jgi:hypothetical protein